MNLLELGAQLKRERERRGLSIRDVMDATKISRRNLTALEAGEVKVLPHPVYLKGYVRNYAKLVGLDADACAAVVDRQSDEDAGYLPQSAPAQEQQAQTPDALLPVPPPAAPEASAASPQPPESAPEPEPASEPEPELLRLHFPDPPPRKKSKAGWLVALFLVLLAAAAGALYWRSLQMRSEEPAPLAQAPAQDNASASLANATQPEALPAGNASAPAPEPVPAQPAAQPAADAKSAEPQPRAQALPPLAPQGAASGPELPGLGPKPKPVAPASALTPASPAFGTATVPGTPVSVSRQAQPAEASAAQPAAPAAGQQQLVITAKPGESCWVSADDGRKSKSFTLRDGESRQIEFAGKLTVRLGNAGGVNFRLNGQGYPYEGKRGSLETVEFGQR